MTDGVRSTRSSVAGDRELWSSVLTRDQVYRQDGARCRAQRCHRAAAERAQEARDHRSQKARSPKRRQRQRDHQPDDRAGHERQLDSMKRDQHDQNVACAIQSGRERPRELSAT